MYQGLVGFVANKWRNSGIPGYLDWGEQVIVITGGSSGIGALLASTFALRHCTVAVLDINPIETDNCQFFGITVLVTNTKKLIRQHQLL
jgi:hypothetical protein